MMKKIMIFTTLFITSLIFSLSSQSANQAHGKNVQRNVVSHSSNSYQRSNSHRSINDGHSRYSTPVRYNKGHHSAYRSNGHNQVYYPAHSQNIMAVHSSSYYGRYYGYYNQHGVYQAYDYGSYDQYGVYLAHRHTPYCGHVATPALGALVAGIIIGAAISH